MHGTRFGYAGTLLSDPRSDAIDINRSRGASQPRNGSAPEPRAIPDARHARSRPNRNQLYARDCRPEHRVGSLTGPDRRACRSVRATRHDDWRRRNLRHRAVGDGERPRRYFAYRIGCADRGGVVVYRVVIGSDCRCANGFGKEPQQNIGHCLCRGLARHTDDSDHDAIASRPPRLADRRLILCDPCDSDASGRLPCRRG